MSTPPTGSSSGANNHIVAPPAPSVSRHRSSSGAGNSSLTLPPYLERLSGVLESRLRSNSGAAKLTLSSANDDSRVADVARRLRGSLSPRPIPLEKPFPINDFQRALDAKEVNFERIRRILQEHGWTRSDLSFIQTKVGLLSENGKLSQDVLIDAIITMAIQKSDEAVFPAFPHINNKGRANHLAIVATKVFCEKGSDLAFNIFLYVLKKFRPENRDVCVSLAFEKAKNDPLLKQRLITAFPDDFSAPKGGGDEDEKEIVCKHAVPVRPFPMDDFQRALQNVEFDSLCKILTEHGWKEADLEMVRPWMGLLRKERIEHATDFKDCASPLMNLDHIVYRLLDSAIENRRPVPFFDFLPCFKGSFGDAEIYANWLGEKITSALYAEPENPLFYELFIGIMRKFQPQKHHLFLSQVLPKLDANKKAHLNGIFLPDFDEFT